MKLKIQSIKNYFKSKKDRGLEPVFFEKIGDQKTSTFLYSSIFFYSIRPIEFR